MKIPLITILAFANAAQAIVTIEYVTVGDVNNPADMTGYGSVSYTYNIGKYEVTNTQYAEFLNTVAKTDTYGLYNDSMGTDARAGITRSGSSGSYVYSVKANMGNKPVNYVSWYDSARFTNWLHNGQPTGLQTLSTTEGGAYTLAGNTGLITKNVGATVWIPTENEWYKAAYYDPTPGASGNNYWLYPTQSDSVPTVATANATGDISNPGANVANYMGGANWNAPDSSLTTVGSALSDSYYGTLDQGGNVWELNDATIGGQRGIRGGSLAGGSVENDLRSSWRNGIFPTDEFYGVGFRVATVPESGMTAICLLTGVFFLARRKRPV